MGKIRLSAFKPRHVSALDHKPTITLDYAKEEGAQQAVHIENVLVDPDVCEKPADLRTPAAARSSPGSGARTARGRFADPLFTSVNLDGLADEVSQWWAFHGGSIWHSVAAGLRVGRTEDVANPYQRPAAFIGLRGHGFQDWD
ncbi:hypothetical protein LTR53_015075 [Teratosphaeriaceae sp. CCFEE 6253]|nr:hypothetical protein LTR53_015075 [Teratosphaeriaceae sp. CCFEE 6253]